LQEMLNLGEFGRLFHEAWWQNIYEHCAKNEPWKTICNEFIGGRLKPEGYKEIGQPTADRPSQTLVRKASGSTRSVRSSTGSISQPSTAQTTTQPPIGTAPPTTVQSVPHPPIQTPPQTIVQTAPQSRQPTTQPISTPPATSTPLPSGWERRVDGSGREYFFNHATNTSHWAKWSDSTGNCEVKFAGNGRPYVFNHTTKASTWLDAVNTTTTARTVEAGNVSPTQPPLTHVQSAPASTGHSSQSTQRSTEPQAAGANKNDHRGQSQGSQVKKELTNAFVKGAVRGVSKLIVSNVASAIVNAGTS
jgi:hypothetical protein